MLPKNNRKKKRTSNNLLNLFIHYSRVVCLIQRNAQLDSKVSQAYIIRTKIITRIKEKIF